MWMTLPLCGAVGAELCVVAVQSVFTGRQQVGARGSRGEADVQRGGTDLQHQQLAGGTNMAGILLSSRPELLR